MSQAETFYEGHSFYEASLGRLSGNSLAKVRERYQVPKELSPKLLALVRKLDTVECKSSRARSLIGTLDAIEGAYLKRNSPPI